MAAIEPTGYAQRPTEVELERAHSIKGLTEALARIAVLVEALRPFSKFAEGMEKMVVAKTSNFPRQGEVYTLMVGGERIELTVEDFKAAKDALQTPRANPTRPTAR